jgi:hypothetical protein
MGRFWRRVPLLPLAIGALAVVVAAAGIMTLVAAQGAVIQVWVAAAEIEADQPLSPADLRAVDVTGPVTFEHLAVGVVDRDELVGWVPRTDVAAGTPLSAGQFHQAGAYRAVEPGAVTVAVVLARPRVPAGVDEGDVVLLVGVPGSTSPAAAAGEWPGSDPFEVEAKVVAITEGSSGSDLSLTVAVPADVGDDAAWLAAENRVVVAHVH